MAGQLLDQERLNCLHEVSGLDPGCVEAHRTLMRLPLALIPVLGETQIRNGADFATRLVEWGANPGASRSASPCARLARQAPTTSAALKMRAATPGASFNIRIIIKRISIDRQFGSPDGAKLTKPRAQAAKSVRHPVSTGRI